MATKPAEDTPVQVATRVPVALLQAVRVHCVRHGRTVMAFVEQALRDKLRRTRPRRV
jgi:hypothetical protein